MRRLMEKCLKILYIFKSYVKHMPTFNEVIS